MRALLLGIALMIMSAAPGLAANLLILQSNRAPAYTEALGAFTANCTTSSVIYVLSDYAEVDVVRLVKEERPRIVLAIGDAALAAAKKVRDVPVISLLALNLGLQREPARNVGGVAMVAAPQQYLETFKALGVKRVGVPYDPDKTRGYVKRAIQSARQAGITLVPVEVGESKELHGKLESLTGQIDALWLLPDTTVATGINVDVSCRFIMKQDIPLISFSSQHRNTCAAVSLDIDYREAGLQAAELVKDALDVESSRAVRTVEPRKVNKHINKSILKKIGKVLP